MGSIQNQRLRETFDYLKDIDTIHNQQHLADMLGINKSTLSQYMTGGRKINLQFAHKFAEKFPMISARWLLKGEGGMFPKWADAITGQLEEPRQEHRTRDAQSHINTLKEMISLQREIIENLKKRIKELEIKAEECAKKLNEILKPK